MPNLYDSLFCSSEQEHHYNHEDISMEIVNQLHGHRNFEYVSNYYDLISYNKLLETHETKKLNIIHINSPKNLRTMTISIHEGKVEYQYLFPTCCIHKILKSSLL